MIEGRPDVRRRERVMLRRFSGNSVNMPPLAYQPPTLTSVIVVIFAGAIGVVLGSSSRERRLAEGRPVQSVRERVVLSLILGTLLAIVALRHHSPLLALGVGLAFGAGLFALLELVTRRARSRDNESARR
jgi:hypothetical protein